MVHVKALVLLFAMMVTETFPYMNRKEGLKPGSLYTWQLTATFNSKGINSP